VTYFLTYGFINQTNLLKNFLGIFERFFNFGV